MSDTVLEYYLRRRLHSTAYTILTYFQTMEQNIPAVLVCKLNLLLAEGEQENLGEHEYSNANREYNEQMFTLARSMISDIPVGALRHHSIHCISFRECLPSVIGMDMDGFSRLFLSLRVPLEASFPRCPEILEYGQFSLSCERRFKLFLCLFRLKQGVRFREMETIFGWSKTVLQEWFDIVLRLLVRHLHNYHEGFLDHMGHNWQRNEVMKWHTMHYALGNVEDYRRKIRYQNNESSDGDLLDPETFVGSIGAVDGTYSVQPRVGRSTLLAHGEDPTEDRMYSEYKKIHAYKLVIVTSHGLENSSKFILWLGFGCGKASDATVYGSFSHTLLAKLIAGAALLGDHAFHAQLGVIAPYTTAQIRAHIGNNLAAFNHDHSSDRMTSEHGVRYMKMWGVVRGRDDSQLFQNEQYYELALKAVWGLHNYIHSNCPIFHAE